MSNLSFEEIRRQVASRKESATKTAAAVSHTITEKAKTLSATVQGFLPVSNNKLERELIKLRLEVARLAACQSLDLAQLRSTLGLPATAIAQEAIDSVANTLVSAMGIVPAEEEVVTAPVEAPEPAPAVDPIVTPVAAPAPRKNTTDDLRLLIFGNRPVAAQPDKPVEGVVSLPMSAPSNWHMGPSV